ncbi:right-handed parallel beta-helix repeat-containing protein [Bacillus songklensis]
MAESELQTKIDALPEGGTLKLIDSIYDGEIVINKPITIEGGKNTVIRSCSDQPVVTLKDDGVVLKNLKIEQCSKTSDTTAIYVTGKNHHLENMQIQSNHYGIKLNRASGIVIEKGSITTAGAGNGIDLWESDHNLIQNVHFENVRDGVYLEGSNGNQLRNNKMEKARYGIHLMFCKDVLVQGNQSTHNFTGIMSMQTDGVKIIENEFNVNNDNVNSQGVLLYDAYRTTILRNEISQNRVGLYMESSRENMITHNIISGNFTGIQFKNANQNTIQQNTFIANVNESQAVKSTDNQIKNNYWDAALKLDANRNGISILPYRADPLFLILTKDVPEYQLFFDSPGMIVLQKLIKSPENEIMKDPQPLTDMPLRAAKPSLISILLTVLISTSMIMIGIKLFRLGRNSR